MGSDLFLCPPQKHEYSRIETRALWLVTIYHLDGSDVPDTSITEDVQAAMEALPPSMHWHDIPLPGAAYSGWFLDGEKQVGVLIKRTTLQYQRTYLDY